jgi:hypothetical protein
MRRDFTEDNMGFRTLQKESQKQAGDKPVSMNLKESVKPTYGVNVKNGEEVNKGPDIYSRKIDNKMSRKDYLDKVESMMQRGTAQPKRPDIDIKKLFNAAPSIES